MPKVSIVIVNYNYGKYLDERIRTILNQSYKDFELIIVDNGSTDNSVEVINRYISDTRVIPKFYSENDLPFKRWNEALSWARGEYFLITAADDSSYPTLLEKTVEKLDKYPSVGIAFSQSWDIDDQGNQLRSWKEWTDNLDKERWAKDFIDDGKNECQYLLFQCTIPNPSAALIRRTVFLEAGKFDTSFRYLTDWILWVKMLLISDIAFIAEPLNNYRTHTGSLTNATKQSLEFEERVRIINYLYTNIKATDEAWEAVYNQTIGYWSNLIIENKISFDKSKKIYSILQSMDQNLNYRLARHLIKYSWKNLINLFSYKTSNIKG
jgi:glycosyltransferase involved in cell wall biosynthesis